MEDVVKAFEVTGVVILTVGSILTFIHASAELHKGDRQAAYAAARRGIGRSILLGLEVLIIADIVMTITIDRTFESALTLGLIVLVRTFLSTMSPSVSALSKVRSIVIVMTMSAMMRTSSPSKIDRPTPRRAAAYAACRSPLRSSAPAWMNVRIDPTVRMTTPVTSNALTTSSISSSKCIDSQPPSLWLAATPPCVVDPEAGGELAQHPATSPDRSPRTRLLIGPSGRSDPGRPVGTGWPAGDRGGPLQEGRRQREEG